MYGNISRYQKINLLKIWFFCVLILRKYLARYFQSLLNSWFFNDFRQEQCKQNTLFSFVNFVTWDYMTLCSYHVKYAFQSESTLYSCLNVKEFLARNRITYTDKLNGIHLVHTSIFVKGLKLLKISWKTAKVAENCRDCRVFID